MKKLGVKQKLSGGDLRSIGRANEIVRFIERNPKRFGEVVLLIFEGDPIVRSRAADVIEKVSKRHPELLKSYKTVILQNLGSFTQKEVRWHIAQIISRLNLNRAQSARAVRVLFKWLNEEDSQIVKVMCLQALFDLAQKFPVFISRVKGELERQKKMGSPAVRARIRKLIGPHGF